MFQYLKDMVIHEAEVGVFQTREMINKSTCGYALSNYYLRSLMTPGAKDLIVSNDGTSPIPDAAAKKMIARDTKSKRKTMLSKLQRIDDALSADIPEIISVSVEWHRGRYGEMNPAVTVRAGGYCTTGYATGSGYDKESAAVASAMNKNSAVLRIWYEHAEKRGKFAYSMLYGEHDPLPHMDGGCGMSAVRDVFRGLGYAMTEHHGKVFDYYEFTNERKKGA